MGDKVLLTVEERKLLGKKVKKLRKDGLVPGVVYGHGIDAQPVMANAKVAEKVWQTAGRRQPVELTVSGKKHLAMIKSADIDPLKRSLRHLSFQVVNQNEEVETEVPVRIDNEGETAAERAGLVVLQAIETVEVSALPSKLPEFVIVPSDKLLADGDHVNVSDIVTPDGVQILTDPEIVVASVYEPSALAAQNEAAAGEATDESEVEAEKGAEAEGEEKPETPAEGNTEKKQ